jgi:hypothetical protein
MYQDIFGKNKNFSFGKFVNKPNNDLISFKKSLNFQQIITFSELMHLSYRLQK